MQVTRIIKVLAGQSLINIACQYCGTAEAMPELALLNNLEYTAELTPGQSLMLPMDSYYSDKVISKYFQVKGIYPASGLSTDFLEELNNYGIGAMIINKTFKVR